MIRKDRCHPKLDAGLDYLISTTPHGCELSVFEIAEACECSPTTIKNYIKSALQKLRNHPDADIIKSYLDANPSTQHKSLDVNNEYQNNNQIPHSITRTFI